MAGNVLLLWYRLWLLLLLYRLCLDRSFPLIQRLSNAKFRSRRGDFQTCLEQLVHVGQNQHGSLAGHDAGAVCVGQRERGREPFFR